MYGEQRPEWYFTHVHGDLNLRILRVFEVTFSLDMAQLSSFKQCNRDLNVSANTVDYTANDEVCRISLL